MSKSANYVYPQSRYDEDNCSEYSESEESGDGACSSSSEDEYEPIWIDKVNAKGDLFYLEPIPCEATGAKNNSSNFENSWELRKSKPSKGLKEWVRYRREQFRRHFKPHPEEIVSECHAAPNIGFTACSTEVKDVYLDIDPNRHNYGRRATLAERLFGLILSPFKDLKDGGGAGAHLVVADVVSEGEAYKEGTIKIGDRLKSIDDIEVTTANIDCLLESFAFPRKVKLVVQRFDNTPKSSRRNTNTSASNNLFDYLAGTVDAKTALKNTHLPYAVYYLSTTAEPQSSENGDVIYCFPDAKGKLFKLKGAFVTLEHMISTVATPPILSCTVALQDGVDIHVCFIIEGTQMMVLAVPNICATLAEFQHITVDVAKLLKLQFFTLSLAFGDVENHEYLNQLFREFFQRLLLPALSEQKGKVESHLLHILPSVHWFPLPPDIKIIVDDMLSQFESADFDDTSEGYYGIRRIYNILGSCLFHKGYLLGSHLTKEDLLDIHLFLQYHGLLSLTQAEPVSRAVIWKEVHPTHKHLTSCELDPDEAEGRYFVLVVAVKQNILATVLEAGGCALSVSGYPSPEPFYVDLVENTLLLLEDSGIFSTICKLIGMQDPQLSFPDAFLRNEEKPNRDILSSIAGLGSLAKRSRSYSNLSTEENKKPLEISSLLKKSHDHDFELEQLISNMGPADGESDEESEGRGGDAAFKAAHRSSASTSSFTSSHDSDENMPLQSSSTKLHFNSSYDLRSTLSSQELLDGMMSQEIHRTDLQNTLFCYLHMDPTEGVFLAPTAQMQKLFQGSAGQDIMQGFYKCCMQMRTAFERSLRNKELSVNSVTPKFGVNNFLQATYEQGALFHCSLNDDSSTKKSMSLTFWVIGRLFFTPEPREVYLCYHDSVQHNVVEVAYRLGFGLSL